MSKILKSVASGIGLVSEGVSTYKENKKSKQARDAATENTISDRSESFGARHTRPSGRTLAAGDVDRDDFTGYEVDTASDREDKKSATTEERELSSPAAENTDELEWALDDAQDEIIDDKAVSKGKTGQLEIHKLAQRFISTYPLQQPHTAGERLPFPVVIPQRRPKRRSRGFLRAYAPCLNECQVGERAFLDFIETFNVASQGNPWIQTINLASFIPMHLPSVTSYFVGQAIQLATAAAQEAHSRHRTNDFLDKINTGYFMPRGLFCLVMCWKPDDQQSIIPIDIASTVGSQVNTRASGTMNKLMHDMQNSAGDSYGDLLFPELAPLVFPDLDKVLSSSTDDAEAKKSKLASSKGFINQYLDKRAHAQYQMENPNNQLANMVEKPTFKSKFADPSNPASQGDLIGMISGGRIAKSDIRPEHEGRSNSRRVRSRSSDRGGPIGLIAQARGADQRRPGRRSGGPIGLAVGLIGHAIGSASESASQSGSRATSAGPSNDVRRSPNELSYMDDYRSHSENVYQPPTPQANDISYYRGESRAQLDYGPPPPPPYVSSRRHDRRARASPTTSSLPTSPGSSRSLPHRGRKPEDRGGLIGGAKKFITPGVHYLLIVNMPTEEEMLTARQVMSAQR